MMYHFSSSHRLSFTAEGRLLHQKMNSSPEVQKTKELMQNPAASLEELQNSIMQGRNAQKVGGEFLETVAQELQQENPETIRKNLDALARRAADQKLDALKSTIEQVRSKIEIEPASPTTPSNSETLKIPESPAEQKSFITTVTTGIGDTAEKISDTVLPQKWTDKLSRGQKIAAGTLMTLGAGVVLWQLGKMLFGRGKRSAEEGKEAASNTKGSFWKKLLIGTGIGIATFFGIRYMLGSYGKDLEKRIRSNLPELPDIEQAKPYLDGAEALSGVGVGMTSKVTERIVDQGDALKEIPLGIHELYAANTPAEYAEIAARHGATLLYKEGKWIWDTGVDAIVLPLKAVQKLTTGDFKNAWEGGWIYGEAGAAYVLGKGTFTALITGGKVRLPLTMRAAGATATRMAAWPIIAVTDAGKTVCMMASDDGRLVTQNIITRWGPMGIVRDSLARRQAVRGAEESLEGAIKYFQYQRELLGAMKRQMEGQGFKGLVREGAVTAIDNSSQLLAKDIMKGAEQVKINITQNGGKVPQWVEHLVANNGLRDTEKIIAEVDEAGGILRKTAMGADVAEATATTAKAVDVATDTVAGAAKAEKAVETAAETSRAFDKLQELILTTRKLGNNEQLLKLLQSPIIKAAAEQGSKLAQRLMNVWRLIAPGMKWAGKAFAVVGPLVDVAFFVANRYDLAAAHKTGNKELIATLESKQQAIVGGGIASASIFVLGAPATAVALPLTIGATIYTQGVYDSMATWQKSPEDWLSYSPTDLRSKMEEYKMGKIDRGHRAAYGYSTAYALWRWGTSWSSKSKEANRQEDEKQGEDIEKINQYVRQELLLAYFMKTKLPPHQGETPELYKERVTPMLQDCMSYMKQFTNGTYDASLLGEKFFDQAKDYADLNAVRRSQRVKEIHYEGKDGQKTLDLSALTYIGQGGNDAMKMKFMQTMHQYETDVKIQKEAVEDFYRLDAPLA